jgi:hypothetical protein
MVRPNATLWTGNQNEGFYFQVPVIVVFTKYDQFKREIHMALEDHDMVFLEDEVEKTFEREYLAHLSESPRFVRLESEHHGKPSDIYYADICHAEMHKKTTKCTKLIEMTANAISDDTAALILLAVQKHNLEVNIKQVVEW